MSINSHFEFEYKIRLSAALLHIIKIFSFH